MKALAFEMRSRITSAAVGGLTGRGCVVVAAVCVSAGGTGGGVWALAKVPRIVRVSKIEVYDLLTFTGIFSPPDDLNFP